MSAVSQEIVVEELTKYLNNQTRKRRREQHEEIESKTPKRKKNTETIIVEEKNADFERWLREIVVAPFPEKSGYWGRREDYGHSITSTDSWKDRKYKNLEIFALKRLSLTEVAAMGDAAYKEIHGRFTPRAIVRLMILAYNLRDKNGNHVIAKVDPKLVNMSASTPLRSVSKKELCRGTRREMLMDLSHDIRTKRKHSETIRRRAIAYTYLAASYLRLFTKHVDNVKRIDQHLKERFPSLYKFEFPFNDFHADVEVIKQMRMEFDMDPKYRNTLYAILFAGRDCKEGFDLKEFLYQMHLNYTGLHVHVLWTRLLTNLQTKCSNLTDALYCNAFREQIDGISVLMTMEHATDPKYKRHMWKFARIFDRTFMSVLQVKNCRMFALTLAYMSVSCAPPEGKDNPLEIAALKECSDADRFEARAIAERAITMIKSEQYEGVHAEAAKARIFAKTRT